MEVQDTIRMQFTEAELKKNYYNTIQRIIDIVDVNDFEIKIDGENGDLMDMPVRFGDLSKNARKNIAKRMHYVDKKKSRKTINTFFLVLNRLGVINNKVRVTLGKKELEIQRKRKVWTIMRDKAQQALNEYKEEKGNFYKKKLV